MSERILTPYRPDGTEAGSDSVTYRKFDPNFNPITALEEVMANLVTDNALSNEAPLDPATMQAFFQTIAQHVEINPIDEKP